MHSELEAGTTYYYWIRAVSAEGEAGHVVGARLRYSICRGVNRAADAHCNAYIDFDSKFGGNGNGNSDGPGSG